MLKLKNAGSALIHLQLAYSFQDVATALEVNSSYLFFIVRESETGRYYSTFRIPKKRGGYREIDRPRRGLAIVQENVAEILSFAYKPKPFVKAYVKGESFLSNAAYHVSPKWILTVDIENFFPSINFGRVYGLFRTPLFGFNHRVAVILARICTYKNGLPQGAVTSPILANLIGSNIDKELVKIAIEHRLNYSRYADDITFSSRQKEIPPGLVKEIEPQFGSREIALGADFINALAKSGFSINPQKTRMLFPSERQVVTGLVVNRRVNVWRKDISRLRMKLYSAQKFGATNAAQLWLGKGRTEKHFWLHIEGWLAFIRQVRGENDDILAKLCKRAIESGLAPKKWMKELAEMVQEFDVFLSHASEDKEKVRPLARALDGLGVKVFFDEDSIKWGESIVEKINHGLTKSTFFLPVLSENFARKGWTNKELNSAIALNISRKQRILPLLMGKLEIQETYPLLADTLYKSWPSSKAREETFIGELADELLALVERQKQASAPHLTPATS